MDTTGHRTQSFINDSTELDDSSFMHMDSFIGKCYDELSKMEIILEQNEGGYDPYDADDEKEVTKDEDIQAPKIDPKKLPLKFQKVLMRK